MTMAGNRKPMENEWRAESRIMRKEKNAGMKGTTVQHLLTLYKINGHNNGIYPEKEWFNNI